MKEATAEEFTLRADLADAREEKRHAAHVIALVKIGGDDELPATPGHFVRRREIELQVAELRLSLWADECRALEHRLRAKGLRP